MSVRVGNKETEVGEIPEEWNVKTFEEITLAKIGLRRGPFGGSLKKEIFVKSGYPVYEQQHAIYKKFDNVRYFIDEKKYTEMKAFQVEAGDILVSCSGTIGKVALVPESASVGVINQALLRVRSDQSIMLNEILVRFLDGENYQKIITGMTHGSAMKNIIGMDSLRKIQFPIPPIFEQRKIVDILSTVDEHISETEALLDKTQVLKKGLMQRLLTKGIGHTEFKDTEIGRIPVEWEIKFFGEICSNQSDKFQPSSDDKRIYIALENIGQNTSRLLSISDSIDSTSLKTKFEKDDVLFGKLRPYLRKYWLAEFDGVCSTEIYAFRANAMVIPSIILYMVEQDAFIEQVTGKSYGSKMPRASWDDIQLIPIPLPPLSEQHKIASILTTIDDQIDVYQTKLASLTKLKSALMQQLLTGKIRVKVNA